MLQVFRRTARGRFTRVYAGDGPAFSRALGGWIVVTDAGQRLRLADDAKGARLWPTEAEQARQGERAARAAEQRARAAEQQARVAEQQARAAEQQARAAIEAERAARRKAERQLSRARAGTTRRRTRR